MHTKKYWSFLLLFVFVATSVSAQQIKRQNNNKSAVSAKKTLTSKQTKTQKGYAISDLKINKSATQRAQMVNDKQGARKYKMRQDDRMNKVGNVKKLHHLKAQQYDETGTVFKKAELEKFKNRNKALTTKRIPKT